jgi:pilus assembly protein CpaC
LLSSKTIREVFMPSLVIIFLLHLFFFSFAAHAGQDLILKIGASQNIASHGQAWVENGKVLRLQETASGFTLRGLKPGKSLLKIDNDVRTVYVLSLAQEESFHVLSDVAKKSLALKTDLEDGEVVVKGRLLRWKELEKIFQTCRNLDCRFTLKAESSPEMKNELTAHLQSLLKAEGLSPQNILFGDGYRVLLNQKTEHLARLKKFFAAFGIHTEVTKESLDLVPVVKVQITVAEIERESGLTYGLQWPASASVQVLPTFGANPTAGMPDQAGSGSLTARFIESHRLGKVLASPNILCRSGEEAKFLAGGEFPIKMISFKSQDVVWKQYGIMLTVKPHADLSGKMSLSLQIEVSKIAGDPIDGIPQLQTNRVESHVDLTRTQIIALSGLISSSDDQSKSGLPGFGNIPILGSLFASKDFQQHRSELVIFLKPEIVNFQQQAGM